MKSRAERIMHLLNLQCLNGLFFADQKIPKGILGLGSPMLNRHWSISILLRNLRFLHKMPVNLPGACRGAMDRKLALFAQRRSEPKGNFFRAYISEKYSGLLEIEWLKKIDALWHFIILVAWTLSASTAFLSFFSLYKPIAVLLFTCV